MKFTQSGVSGLLGFLNALEKGRQESRQYQDQTAQMGLQFAQQQNEQNRQSRAEQQAREAFQLQKDQFALTKQGAEQTKALTDLQIKAATRANDPYQIGFTQRQPYSDAIAKLEATLPDLVKSYSAERTPAGQQAILAKINQVKREVSRQKNTYRQSLNTLGLTPQQIDELMLFGANGATQQGAPQPPQAGFNVPGVAAQTFDVAGAQPVKPAPSFNPGENLPLTQGGGMGGSATGVIGGQQKPSVGMIGAPQAQGAPPSQPVQLPNGNIGIDPELSTYLAGLGMSIQPGKDHELTPDEYKVMTEAIKGRNLSSLVGPQNLSRVTLNKKGVIDLNAPLPSIDYGKVVQTLYAPIGQAFAATARQMNRSVADIQRAMIGDDPANWPLDENGNPQTPADGGAALKAAMMPYIGVDAKTVNDWTATQALNVKENYQADKEKRDRDFEALQNKLNRNNQYAIAQLGKNGQVQAAAKTAGQATMTYISNKIQSADDLYTDYMRRMNDTLAAGNPTTLEEIGFTSAKTKQRIPIDVAKRIVDTTTDVMIKETEGHVITNFEDPIGVVNGYSKRKSQSILKARYKGLDAGVKLQFDKVQAKQAGQGTNPLPATDDDVKLLESLRADRDAVQKLLKSK